MARNKKEEEIIGNYKLAEKPLEFISSGCTLLDCTIGGGFPLRRISNVVGNNSTNKTGIGVEVMANFRKQHPEGKIWYHEAESAFNLDYAYKLGMPKDDNTFLVEDAETVETFDKKIHEAMAQVTKDEVPGLYILDTLDAIKMASKDLNEGYDAARRAALVNSLITNLAGEIKRANMHLLIVSQVRENIGGGIFSEKYKRSGGKALDFYASQVIWLSVMEKISHVYQGIKLTSGIWVKAQVKKNKVGLPFRTCEFPVLFHYGIHDALSSLEWLKNVKGGLDSLGISKNEIEALADEIKDNKDIELKKKIDDLVRYYWDEINNEFLPTVSKY